MTSPVDALVKVLTTWPSVTPAYLLHYKGVELKAAALLLSQQARVQQLSEENAGLRDKYEELIFGVATKFPDESRHQTALRYILQREASCSGPAQESQRKD